MTNTLEVMSILPETINRAGLFKHRDICVVSVDKKERCRRELRIFLRESCDTNSLSKQGRHPSSDLVSVQVAVLEGDEELKVMIELTGG